ncbi:uncharacterized protein BDR25DRAFT_350717 [Lindgomyces ingoldianus]|uniref:Uncharacterized protein n=1 Tax=Lindgomyces ingoldianus TaxID=673940 RepID=A0ACB6R845_9PLEO|nr:uncharacterized protein BDR25DRAFT_350717 [Lindgomyces ingoldianus]KAF2475331.1 hypothetical protein BDR25DRAFT_350717 [Lindgomyces ingoldianus]
MEKHKRGSAQLKEPAGIGINGSGRRIDLSTGQWIPDADGERNNSTLRLFICIAFHLRTRLVHAKIEKFVALKAPYIISQVKESLSVWQQKSTQINGCYSLAKSLHSRAPPFEIPRLLIYIATAKGERLLDSTTHSAPLNSLAKPQVHFARFRITIRRHEYLSSSIQSFTMLFIHILKFSLALPFPIMVVETEKKAAQSPDNTESSVNETHNATGGNADTSQTLPSPSLEPNNEHPRPPPK